MKTVVMFVLMLFGIVEMFAQTSYYSGNKEFVESDYVYVCELDCTDYVVLHNKEYKSQKPLKVDFSISKEKEALFIHVKNDSDSTLYILNDIGYLHRHEDLKWSHVYISNQKKEYYNSYGEMYFPIQIYTGEKWFDKKRVSITPIPSKEERWLDISSFKKDLLSQKSVYVKLVLYLTADLTQAPRKPMIVEKWVPVE